MKGKNDHTWGMTLFAICVIAFLLNLTGGSSKSQTREPQKLKASQFAIYDGDTVRWPKDKPLRLLQVNAPERGACLGWRATVRMAELVGTKGELKVLYDTKLNSDRFERVLAYVEKDGKDLGEQMLREGLARTYFIGGERGDRAARYVKAQADARKHRRGVWRSCASDERRGR